MGKVTQEFITFGTYLMSFFSIALAFETVKDVIIFLFTMALLIIQIKLHLKRLKKEDEKDSGKKN